MDDNYGPSGCGNSGSCLHFASPPEPPPPPMPVTCDEGDCPAHLTSYHGTPTGCKNFCKAAFQRRGQRRHVRSRRARVLQLARRGLVPTRVPDGERVVHLRRQAAHRGAGGRLRAHGHRAAGHARARAAHPARTRAPTTTTTGSGQRRPVQASTRTLERTSTCPTRALPRS